jgi:hypothetical protein
MMDLALRHFLDSVRPRSRAKHLSTYEDLAAALDCFLKHRRRSVRALRPSELRSFLAYWYLRHYHPLSSGGARRFCAALRVLVRWLAADRPTPRARELRLEMARVARQTARAARVSELLELTFPVRWQAPGMVVEDGYWEVLLRGDSHVVLRPLGGTRPIGPVNLPAAVVRALSPGAILNLQLVDAGGSWEVLDHGLCYPSVAAPALRTASPTPA